MPKAIDIVSFQSPLSYFFFDDRREDGEVDNEYSRENAEDYAHHFSSQISWVIWRVMAEIREPIIYVVFLIIAIIYFQLSANVIGIDDQFKFRKEINQLLERVRH